MDKTNTIRYFSQNLFIVMGLVLIWRGVWFMCDIVDELLFGGSHVITSIGGILLGLAILYLPDRDLKEIHNP